MEFPAPNLNIEQLQEGLSLGLYDMYEKDPSGPGFRVIVNKPATGQIESILAFISDPPAFSSPVTDQLRKLTDAYLSFKACYNAIPDTPSTGNDPWAELRADCKARVDAAYNALVAGGGPLYDISS